MDFKDTINFTNTGGKLETEFKTGTLGKDEVEVRQKFSHDHKYNKVGKCFICGREEKPFWGDKKKWTSGKDQAPST